MSETARTRRDHALMIGDGWLFTAGTMSVAMALMFGLVALLGPSQRSGLLSALLSNVLLLGGGVAGVVIAWRIHGRPIDLVTVLGGFAGTVLGGLLVPIAAGLSFLLGLPLGLVTDWEFAGPVAMLVLLSAALLVLVAWLLVDAVRDLLPERREHIRLDLGRIAAALAFIVTAAVWVYLIFAQPAPEQGEAVIWVMAGGAVGAGAIAGADLLMTMTRRSQSTSPAADG